MPTLYDDDVALWAEQQSRLLRDAGRQRRNEPIDWDHVAEEIESAGQSQKHELQGERAASALVMVHRGCYTLEQVLETDPGRPWLSAVLAGD